MLTPSRSAPSFSGWPLLHLLQLRENLRANASSFFHRCRSRSSLLPQKTFALPQETPLRPKITQLIVSVVLVIEGPIVVLGLTACLAKRDRAANLDSPRGDRRSVITRSLGRGTERAATE